MNQKKRSSQSGFTLIELLIVVAIIGILAAIAIPRLLHALERGRQTRSMGDIRTLAQGCTIYQNDVGFFPRLGNATSIELELVITPHQLGTMPLYDGWLRPIIYQADDAGVDYTLMSHGRNGAADPPYVYGPTRRFDDDIILSGGVFIQWPDGPQGN